MRNSVKIRCARVVGLFRPLIALIIFLGQLSTAFAAEPVYRGEDPSMGLISSTKFDWWFCGATVLRPNWALTTSVCCQPPDSIPQDDLSITAGSTKIVPRQKSDKGPVQTVNTKFYLHPGQNKITYKVSFCLLEMKSSLTFFDQDLGAASIYSYSAGVGPAVGSKMGVYRWMTSSSSSPYSMSLEKLPCTIMTGEECLKHFPYADLDSTVCCNVDNPQTSGMFGANQLMLQNATTGLLAVVGHQLAASTKNSGIGLFHLASRASVWISSMLPPAPEPVYRGEDPSMAIISSTKLNWWFCGATVVSPTWALSTSFCCDPPDFGPQDDLSITAGSTKVVPRQKLDKSPVQTVDAKFYRHPGWSEHKNAFCLLELKTPLTFFDQDLAAASIYTYPAGVGPAVGSKMVVYRWMPPERSPPFSIMSLEKLPCTIMTGEECLKHFSWADLDSSVCCDDNITQVNWMFGANQLMLQNATTGRLAVVGHQLGASTKNAGVGLFHLASRASAWISSFVPPLTPAVLDAALAEADTSSLTSTFLSPFSESLSVDMSSLYAFRYFNWTQLLLKNTTKELAAEVERIRGEIIGWERIASLSGDGLLPRPSLVVGQIGKLLSESPGTLDLLDKCPGATWNRTKNSTLVQLEAFKWLDKSKLDPVYGRSDILGVNTTHWLKASLNRNLIDPLWTRVNWLEFLQMALQTLSSSDIQTRSKSELAMRIGRCDLPAETTLLNCIANIVSTFPQPSSKTPVGVLQTFKALSPVAQQTALKDLNGLVQVTLKEGLSCSYDSGSSTLVARGRYVSLKGVVNDKDDCVRAYQGRIKKLLIFASAAFFLDFDVKGADIAGREGEPLSLIVFAPSWEVVGRSDGSTSNWLVDLSGGVGKDAPSSKPGQDGRGVGMDGQPGGPGQNGGNFFIMGQYLSQSAKPAITVVLNGGRGGRGQDGGDGVKGPDGRDPEFTTEAQIARDPWNFDAEEYVKRYPVPCTVSTTPSNSYIRSNESFWEGGSSSDFYQFTCPGIGDGPGKEGGGGGKGGIGGNPGIFTNFLGFSASPETKSGGSGGVGKGGVTGANGNKGRIRIIQYQYSPGFRMRGFYRRIKDDFVPAATSTETTTTKGGNPGLPTLSACDGCSIINPVAPPSPSSPNRYWSGYLSFALDALDMYNGIGLSRFLVSVEGQGPFQLSREPLEPLQDLQAIEVGAARLQENAGRAGVTPPDLWIKPLLSAFLSKVYSLAASVALPNIVHPRRHIPAAEYRKALFFLYTAVYSRLESFSDSGAEPLLVVNVAGYLNNAAASFKDLQISQQNLQRLALVGRTNEAYQGDISAKFKEADLFIQNILNPGLEKCVQQIERSTDDIVSQIVELERQANKDLKALEALQAKLRARGPLDIFLGIFGMIGSAVAMFGIQGEIAGSVMNLAGGVMEAATLSGNPDDVPLTPIPASISAADTALAQKLKEKNEGTMRTYWAQLDYISDLLRTDNSSDVRPLEREVAAIRTRFTTFQKAILSDVGSNSLFALEASTNFTTLYQESQASLNAAFTAVDLKIASRQMAKDDDAPACRELGWERPEAVERAERVSQVGLDTFNRYKGDQSRLDVVARQIAETKQAMANMKLQKANVENVMVPVLVQMRVNLDRARQTMAKQSAVALMVNQWQVQQMLKTLKTELRKMFTAGFSSLEESLATAFENLQETMTTLTNVYDKLETLQGQSKLANLISRGQSAALTNVIVNDPDLNRALNNLQAVIQSIVVSDQYEFALKSFNTWIFPFARFFSGEFQLPMGMQSLMMNASAAASGATIQINGSMNAEAFVGRLLDTVGTRLDKLRVKMSDYQNTIMDFDGVLIPKAQFYRPRCFYTWPASKFRGQITSLLKGQRVTINADVRGSNGIFHAVKFRKIRLEFGVAGNSSSATPQILNDYLSHFTVRLAHTGNSGYRYGSSYFNVMTPTLRLEYSYSAPGAPYPVDANMVYEKLMTGDLSLSPYTMWDIQLLSDSPGVEAIPGFFEVMQMAVSGLDLYLVGEGSRVTPDQFTEEQLQLDRYYNKEVNVTIGS